MTRRRCVRSVGGSKPEKCWNTLIISNGITKVLWKWHTNTKRQINITGNSVMLLVTCFFFLIEPSDILEYK